METRKIEAVFYGKFNAKEKRGSLLYANRKGISIIDKPFNKVLEEVKAIDQTVNVDIDIKETKDKTGEAEVVLLWQKQIHENYIRIRGGLQ